MKTENEDQQCIVYGCTNKKHEGKFIGDICLPCHEMLTTGKRSPSGSFIGRIYDGLMTISSCDWKTAGELRKMARDAMNFEHR